MEEMDFRCVECGYRINKELFIQYSPGNIRLMKCENCRAVADEYIECEIMILLLDLILHKPKAYRHLLYNMIHLQAANLEGLFWKLAVGYLLLDAYRIVLLNRSEEEWGLSVSIPSLVSRCGKMLMDLFFGNSVFLCTLLLMTRYFLDESAGSSRYKDILFTILISSYFKIFLIAMTVWEFPLSVLFIIDIFVLSSNTVALKGLSDPMWYDECQDVHQILGNRIVYDVPTPLTPHFKQRKIPPLQLWTNGLLRSLSLLLEKQSIF